jgi:hypothetical protein
MKITGVAADGPANLLDGKCADGSERRLWIVSPNDYFAFREPADKDSERFSAPDRLTNRGSD